MKRRNFLSILAASVPFLALSKQSGAFTVSNSADSGLPVPQGAWNILSQATDGTDPSTAITALPKITKQIASMRGQKTELEGYLISIPSPGKEKLYVLSRAPYHCGFCYAGGRASLVLVQSAAHLPEAGQMKTVKLSGTFDYQDNDPEDYYFQLNQARKA